MNYSAGRTFLGTTASPPGVWPGGGVVFRRSSIGQRLKMQGRARNRGDKDEVQRYKAAANAALDQLEWVIDYLYRIRKPRLEAALRRNREDIARRLRSTR